MSYSSQPHHKRAKSTPPRLNVGGNTSQLLTSNQPPCSTSSTPTTPVLEGKRLIDFSMANSVRSRIPPPMLPFPRPPARSASPGLPPGYEEKMAGTRAMSYEELQEECVKLGGERGKLIVLIQSRWLYLWFATQSRTNPDLFLAGRISIIRTQWLPRRATGTRNTKRRWSGR